MKVSKWRIEVDWSSLREQVIKAVGAITAFVLVGSTIYGLGLVAAYFSPALVYEAATPNAVDTVIAGFYLASGLTIAFALLLLAISPFVSIEREADSR
jgi:hypothetical protein